MAGSEAPSEYSLEKMRVTDSLDLLAALIAFSLIILTLAGHASVPRLLLTAAFAFFVPGRAIVTNWPALARWSEAAMPIVISLATLALVATLTLWAHLWHPVGLFQLEAVASILALAAGVARRHLPAWRDARRQLPDPGQARRQLPESGHARRQRPEWGHARRPEW